MINSRTKGNRFEAEVCRILHARAIDYVKGMCGERENRRPDPSSLKQADLLFRRRTTTVAPMDDWHKAGDLCVASLVKKETSVEMSVECKSLASVNDLSDIMLRKAAPIRKAWSQAVRQAGGSDPMLAFRLPNRVTALAMRDNDNLARLFRNAHGDVAYVGTSILNALSFSEGRRTVSWYDLVVVYRC